MRLEQLSLFWQDLLKDFEVRLQAKQLPCEKGMFLQVQDKDDVAWLKTWFLVSLPVEHNLLPISHSCAV